MANGHVLSSSGGISLLANRPLAGRPVVKSDDASVLPLPAERIKEADKITTKNKRYLDDPLQSLREFMSVFWNMDDPMEFLRDFNLKKYFSMTFMNTYYDFDSLLQHLGLLNKEATCPKCGSIMIPYLPRRKVFRCTKTYCRVEKGLYTDTFFQATALSTKEIFQLSYFWTRPITPTMAEITADMEREDGTTPCSISLHGWLDAFRDVCANDLETKPVRVGGAGVVVHLKKLFLPSNYRTKCDDIKCVAVVAVKRGGNPTPSSGKRKKRAANKTKAKKRGRRKSAEDENEDEQAAEDSSDNDSDEGEEAARDDAADQPAETSTSNTVSDYRRACYLIPLEASELKAQKHVLPESCVQSDLWPTLDKPMFELKRRAKAMSLNLVTLSDGYSGPADVIWRQFLDLNTRLRGIRASRMPAHVKEFNWKKKYQGKDALYNLWSQVREQYNA